MSGSWIWWVVAAHFMEQGFCGLEVDRVLGASGDELVEVAAVVGVGLRRMEWGVVAAISSGDGRRVPTGWKQRVLQRETKVHGSENGGRRL